MVCTSPRACPHPTAWPQGERVLTAMKYDPNSSTEIRSRLRLRSTTPGANNRLDIQAIVSWDRADGQAVNMMGEPPAGEPWGRAHRPTLT